MKNLFALDVGTRNVVGLLVDYEENKIIIKKAITLEHETRAMEDGQIHDIEKVAKTVLKIKESIENGEENKLTKVAVAVAGRALITSSAKAEKEFDPKYEITEENIATLELIAVQNSMMNLNEKYKEYHCVGYTVSEYKLDDEYIKNPKFQKGSKLEVEVLATFLPKIVVDSIFTMAKKVDLEIINLTLEPIAAISVVISEDMRKLNLALVDIGAGTSDIAVTKSGKIIGYEMVPMAGDEITEKISEDYILDFIEAEKIKRELNIDEEKVKYTDVLGMEYEIDKKDILGKIEPVIHELSHKIADKILELNGKAPQAIILIGGGSLIPLLRENLSEAISLPIQRVAVRGTEIIKNMIDKTNILTTAEFITPVGIANMAINGRGFKIISVTINSISHRVFSFKNSVTLIDTLLSSGLSMKKLYSTSGNPITFKLNGKLRFEKGEIGQLAAIKVNGEKRNLEGEIFDNDDIEIIYKRAGRDAVFYIEDLKKEYKNIEIKINNEKRVLEKTIKVNGEIKANDYLIKDNDEIEIKEKFLAKDILNSENSLKFYINGKEMEILVPNEILLRGNKELDLNSEIFNGDILETKRIDRGMLKVKDVMDIAEDSEEIKVIVNEETINFGKRGVKILKNNNKASGEDIIENGDRIEVLGSSSSKLILSDIFNYYNPEDLIKKRGGVLHIEVNGKKAEFITPIKNGDVIKLYY